MLLLEAATRQLPVTDPDIAAGFAGARGDIMRGLAIGYDWLGQAMTPAQRAARTILQAVVGKRNEGVESIAVPRLGTRFASSKRNFEYAEFD
ncbi:MAG: hypothetical protein KJ000_30265 [Pirellulaceae bacterium]|nr:hypothetical protein [Pirellulaceae bacterium]